MKILGLYFFLFLFVGSKSVLAQSNSSENCNCLKEFDFTTHHIEKNYPGFNDKVTKTTLKAYTVFKKDLYTIAKHLNVTNDCVELLNQYIAYFNDGHIQIFNDSGPVENKFLYPNRRACKTDYTPYTIDFKKLTSQTVYLQIGTFSERIGNKIESLIRSNKAEIDQSENIILDLRGNEGGAVFTFQPLLPFLALDSIQHIGFDVLASSDNIKAYERQLMSPYIPDNQKLFIENHIKRMKQNEEKYVSLSEDYYQIVTEKAIKQRKIVIIIDNNCASTTEHFLLAAKQSPNVTILGEPTLGIYDYGDMHSFNFLEIPYRLFCATNRSRKLDLGQGLDNIGIHSDIYLNRNKSWIREALTFLEKKQ